MGESEKMTWWSRIAGAPLLRGGVTSGFAERMRPLLASPWPDLVGVDLSDRTLKVVHVVRRGARLVRVDSAESALPGIDARPAERRDAARAVLTGLVQELSLRGKAAAATISGNDVVVRRITLPEMSRADILPALALECRKHVNFPIEDAEIRYEIVGRAERPEGRDLLLLVSVAHRRRLEETREILEGAGLKPALLTIRPVALRSFLRAAGEIRSEQVVAYLDMGSINSHIMVLKGEDMRFSREFSVGGATLTEALRSVVVPGQGTIELSLEEAEALKRAHGIPTGAEESGRAGRIPLSAVGVMLRPILERLVRELWNSFDYCNEQFQGEAVTRVVLLGSGSLVPNFSEYLAGVLKIPVEQADPAKGVVEAALGGPSAALEIAAISEQGLGLALSGRASLNFQTPAGAGLPYRIAEAVPQRLAAAAALALLVSVALPAQVGVLRQQQRIGVLQSGLEELAPRTEAVRQFRAVREEETRLKDLLAHLAGGQILWSYTLRDLSHRIGPDVRLTALEVAEPPPSANSAAPAGRQIRLTGLLRTAGRRPEDVLGELMQSLQRSPVLDRVRLEGCESVTASVSTFTVSATVVE